MRIVVAAPLFPPELGGPATYAKALKEGLPNLGIMPDIVKFSDVRHLPKLLRHLVYFNSIKKAAKNAHAILALDPVSVGLPAIKAAKRMGKPFFLKVGGDYAWEQGVQRFGVTLPLDVFVKTKDIPFPVRVLRDIQARVARNADCVIVPSEYLKEIVSTWGVPKQNITVIYNSVTLSSGGEVPGKAAMLPRPRIVTAGRLVPWKNIEGVIEAVDIIKKGSLIVIGDGPLREDLEIRASEKDFHFEFTGALSHADTLATIKDGDVFVLNSTYEGLSHLLIEALSLGIPTVATRAGGNSELLMGEESGILVSPGDVEELAHALEKALQKARGSGEVFRKRFSQETMLQETAALLLQAV